MNKQIKTTVYKILEKDKLAIEDTMYLVQQTVIQLLNCNEGTAFAQVLQGMKYQGISFEAITRAKRKYLEEHPNKISKEMEQIRNKEEEEYFLEYGKHVPYVDYNL